MDFYCDECGKLCDIYIDDRSDDFINVKYILSCCCDSDVYDTSGELVTIEEYNHVISENDWRIDYLD